MLCTVGCASIDVGPIRMCARPYEELSYNDWPHLTRIMLALPKFCAFSAHRNFFFFRTRVLSTVTRQKDKKKKKPQTKARQF